MMGNWFKTGLLMAAIVALFGSVGALLGGGQGMVLALALGLGINLWAYWFSDTMVLKLYRAQEVDARTAPELYGTVKELAEGAGLPMPKVYLIDEAQPNAFATGRNPEHAAIAATTGILQLLNARELRAVLGHELTHVKHRDILTSTVTASIAGAISTLAQFSLFFGGRNDDNRNPVVALLVLILAPIAAMLIQLAISRAREYEADRGGALIHELAYGTLRFLGQLKAIVRTLADRPLADASVEALLWVALYQLVHTSAPAYIVVDCAVRATSRVRRTSAKGLVNAILRHFLRRKVALLAEIASDPEARFSYPPWWIERVRAEYPEHFAEILDAGNARPPLCLRANVRRIVPDAFVA